MKPSTLIVMSVGLIITLAGFLLCLFSKASIESKYPERDLFSYEGDFYEIVEGDTVRKMDFSDVIYKTVNDTNKEISQDVKVLSLTLQNIDDVLIIGHQNVSEVEVYNMTPGRYACEISSGVITLSNVFDETMIFNYLSDIVTNFNGIRRFFNPDVFESRHQKVIVNIDDDDVLNRIDLNLTNCKNVTVKNLTCSLDCKVVLNNSSLVFDSCIFKDPEIIYSGEEGDGEDGGEKPEPTVINHYLTMDLNMRNGSSFETKTCKFSSINAVVNKKMITAKDVEDNPDYTTSDIGKYISSKQTPCTIKLDLSASDILYGFDVENYKDAEYIGRYDLITVIDGLTPGDVYKENADSEDYPQIYVSASNCSLTINH